MISAGLQRRSRAEQGQNSHPAVTWVPFTRESPSFRLEGQDGDAGRLLWPFSRASFCLEGLLPLLPVDEGEVGQGRQISARPHGALFGHEGVDASIDHSYEGRYSGRTPQYPFAITFALRTMMARVVGSSKAGAIRRSGSG